MNVKINGEVIEVFPTKQVTDKFCKREFVVKTLENSEYPEVLKLEVIQDKCGHLDYIGKGDIVDVSVNLKGRAWTNPKTKESSYFNTLQAWNIDKQGGVTKSVSGDTVEDLPF